MTLNMSIKYKNMKNKKPNRYIVLLVLFIIFSINQISIASKNIKVSSLSDKEQLRLKYRSLFFNVNNLLDSTRKQKSIFKRSIVEYESIVDDQVINFETLIGKDQNEKFIDRSVLNIIYRQYEDTLNNINSKIENKFIEIKKICFSKIEPEDIKYCNKEKNGNYSDIKTIISDEYYCINVNLLNIQKLIYANSNYVYKELSINYSTEKLQKFNEQFKTIEKEVDKIIEILKPILDKEKKDKKITNKQIKKAIYSIWFPTIKENSFYTWFSSELKEDIIKSGIDQEAGVNLWWVSEDDVNKLIFWAKNIYNPSKILY